MARRPRPRSPDVHIYRPQLTSVLSITHRASGIWLALGAIALVAWLFVVVAGGDVYVVLESFLGSWIGYVLLFSWTLALFYHLCNGIRHLAWDLDYGFELRRIYLSGWCVLATSAVLTGLTWAIALSMGT
jgi:succinate dehydrogenase / fumarate reductase cytochrome b subunit